MKRFVLIIACVAAAKSAAAALPVISGDFYLNNGSVEDESDVQAMKILPNTLCITLFPGEQAELYAEVYPESGIYTEFSWNGDECRGVADIYPMGKSCVIIGVSEGEGRIRIAAPGGEERYVFVRIKTPPKIGVRSFDYEGEQPPSPIFAATAMNGIVCVLAIAGAVVTAFATIAAIRSRREEREK